MPRQPFVLDPNAPNLLQQVLALKPSPGTCVFIDIVGSTAMKSNGIQDWVARISNGFTNALPLLSGFMPLKGIGDELMYFIEDEDLAARSESHLALVDALFGIAGTRSTIIPATKIVAAHCTDVYPMTFLPGTCDYYGSDVDRTARLKSIAPALDAHEIVVDSNLLALVDAKLASIGNAAQYTWRGAFQGPIGAPAKGLSTPLNFYRATA